MLPYKRRIGDRITMADGREGEVFTIKRYGKATIVGIQPVEDDPEGRDACLKEFLRTGTEAYMKLQRNQAKA